MRPQLQILKMRCMGRLGRLGRLGWGVRNLFKGFQRWQIGPPPPRLCYQASPDTMGFGLQPRPHCYNPHQCSHAGARKRQEILHTDTETRCQVLQIASEPTGLFPVAHREDSCRLHCCNQLSHDVVRFSLLYGDLYWFQS